MPVAGDPVDAYDLVSAARDLIRVDDRSTAGLWPRASAMLCRQAIEASLDDLWGLRCPAMRETSTKCQLLCLGDFLHDVELAGRVSATWDGLSRACHVRVYELAPTVEELQSWLEGAWELADAVARQGG
ncbi:MAG: hypothetical protein JF887_00675 [Candidatus Dormibacteraeota bacterium]|uniref:HEPN domain-containing protein n=1 Tax=Candidatus Amunia macphersoniae TaxID=3127014 RepID=A0A934KCS5_9BACT|nr:hypothetical protein [Candidatus Dormibacteraeota bacterium]